MSEAWKEPPPEPYLLSHRGSGGIFSKRELSFKRKMQLVTHSKPDHGKRLSDFLRTLRCSGNSQLSETCGLSVGELEEMAARQARQLETQEQLLAAKAQRLRYLKSGGEAERLQRLREKVVTQEERLRKLRALRGKVQSNKHGNAVLSSDLESLRAVFNEKEKELSVAVAKVDELTRQLEDLRRGKQDSANGPLSNNQGSNSQSAASVELEKLRRELMYRQKLREAQATRVAAQRAALTQRQEESNRVDRRIAELQERLHRKRFLNHQLVATLKHQENVEDFLNDGGIPNKNDSKYQTLPYNAKFTPFKNQQHQSNQYVQDQAKFDKAVEQMQIITLEQKPQPQQQLGNNNKLMNSFQNNFQQVLSQNQQNAKSANSSNLAERHQTPSSSHLLPNGIGQAHHYLPKGNSMSGTVLGENEGRESGGGCPLVRPSHFLPTGGPESSGSFELNGLFNSQSGTTREVTSSTGSNGSISGSSSSDGVGLGYGSNNGDGRNTSRPALPPKPSKPTPPSRQAAPTGDSISSNQRILSSGEGMGMISDRTELPIKPKPLFLKKMNSNSSSGNGAPVPSTSDSHQSPTVMAGCNGINNNSTVRMSVNRRIEMPPAFLFPESDPPPSDLVPEQYSSSSTTSSLSSTSLPSSLDVNQSGEGGLRSVDTVDAAPLLHLHQKSSPVIGIEEYTLPELFLNPTSSIKKSSDGNFIQPTSTTAPYSPNNNSTNQFPSAMAPSQGSVTTNYSNNNNNYPSTDELMSKGSGVGLGTNVDPNSGTFPSHDDQVAVMSIELDGRIPFEDGYTPITKQQLESSDAVIENGNENRSGTGTEQLFGNEGESQNETLSLDTVGENNGNVGDSLNNWNPHISVPGIIKRLKKGNLKPPNKESSSNGRRVSFDPLALLLDASLEGELELVMKTAKEVGNASAANDEGITALHNAICAGHAEVVRFLVEFGCDVNAQDSDGWTPLHCAASCNNVGMVKFLVEHGACIFATTLSDHETAAEKCEEDEDGFGPCSEYLYSIQEKLGIANSGVVYAVFDYEAQNPDEINFSEAQRLTVLRKGDEVEREWWWCSSENEMQGYVPRNLLGLYPRVKPERRKGEC